ncbi:MAG: DUF1972 domain-containing protein [Candidatus Komeilibacteria bacterium]|nr:DUF1972 domain-containing protein [Candidatus Komeilibacteria bacterium]
MINKTIAILGHRGIPASYGGFETLAAEISPLLAQHGLIVTNYCRGYLNTGLKSYLGSRLIYLPAWRFKSLETLSHTFFATIHLYLHPTDCALVLNVGNALFAWLLKLRGIKVLLNVDGLEWRRKKWGPPARAYFKFSAWLATKAAHALITDSEQVKNFYLKRFNKESLMIPYGATQAETENDQEILAEYGLEPKKYFLFLARFEPENNPLLVRQAYEKSATKMPIVMVGDAPYAQNYISRVKKTADQRVKFLSAVYGAKAKVLMKNALAYIRASEVGGISPALVETMGLGTCVIANDTGANHQAAGADGIYYQLGDGSLTEILDFISINPHLAVDLGVKLKKTARIKFAWPKIAEQYFKLINSVVAPDKAVSVKAIPKSPLRQASRT